MPLVDFSASQVAWRWWVRLQDHSPSRWPSCQGDRFAMAEATVKSARRFGMREPKPQLSNVYPYEWLFPEHAKIGLEGHASDNLPELDSAFLSQKLHTRAKSARQLTKRFAATCLHFPCVAPTP